MFLTFYSQKMKAFILENTIFQLLISVIFQKLDCSLPCKREILSRVLNVCITWEIAVPPQGSGANLACLELDSQFDIDLMFLYLVYQTRSKSLKTERNEFE